MPEARRTQETAPKHKHRRYKFRANRQPESQKSRKPRGATKCKTRQDTWRIKRTWEGQRLTGKAPPKTMGATTEGARDVDGCDDGGKGREGSQGKRLSLELRLPLSIPPKELGSLDCILSLGHLRCPRTCMRSSPHGEALEGPKTKGDGRVPPKRGTKWLRNEGRRACDANTRHQMAQKRR